MTTHLRSFILVSLLAASSAQAASSVNFKNRYSYGANIGWMVPTDIIHTPQRANSLAIPVWSSSLADIVPLGSVPGPGGHETVTVRSTHPISTTAKDYLRLQVTLTP